MKISFKADYALKALLDLALHSEDGTVQVIDIAKRQDIPLKYLSQILAILKGAGFVQSRRGPGGGYWLAKFPDQITLGQVVRLMDGPTSPIGCVSRSGYTKCNDEPFCAFRGVWIKVRDAVNEIIDNTTFKDLCEIARKQNTEQNITYYI